MTLEERIKRINRIAFARYKNMWRTLRINKSITAKDLSVLSTTQKIDVSLKTARRYLNILLRAGYVAKRGKNYRLIPNMDTGPEPPIFAMNKFIVDQNTNKIRKLENANSTKQSPIVIRRATTRVGT